MIRKRDFGECGYPSSQPRYPNGPFYPQGGGPLGPYGGRPRGLAPLFNYICHCERMCNIRPTSSTEKSKKKKIDIIDQQNECAKFNQDGSSKKMFYWVINDPENTDPRVQDIVCVDSAENRPLKPAEVLQKPDCGKNEIYWEYATEPKSGPQFSDVSGKKRSVRNRKPTATVGHTYRLKKHLRNKLKENSLQESSEENVLKFDFPEEIREPQRGDLICWLGKSKDGPLSGVRAIWEAEEITEEPGKICWLGREVTDRETNSALRYGYKSTSGKHNWKSRPGYCLPPISSLKQKPIDLIQRLTTLKRDSSSKGANSSLQGGFCSFDDDKLQSVSAYNIPSELLKTVSWQDFKANKMTNITR